MTPLDLLIREEIARDGPLPMERFMALCLAHPDHGYYRRRPAIGAEGDFITAPETSQIFGELIGLWLVQCWIDQGRPAPFTLAELGPGRGVLMADALRAARLAPDFLAAARLCLVETSPHLRAQQAARLTPAEPGFVTPIFVEAVAELPPGPLFLIANEFFDALPTAQYVYSQDHWRACGVGLRGDALVRTTLGPATPPNPPQRPASADVVEHSAAAVSIATEISARIARDGGAALLIDYGYAEPADRDWRADTLQAMRDHAYVSPFEACGEADLTTHVNFSELARAAVGAGAAAYGPLGQGALLRALGAEARAAALARAAPDRAEEIAAGLGRLTAPDQMGTLFKGLALAPADAAPPPAFTP